MNNTTVDYFHNLGIDVYFNTLGRTKELVNAYVSDTQSLVEAIDTKQSQFAKAACYDKYYFLPSRKKLTGFENFKKIDEAFRIEQRTNFNILWVPGKVVNKYIPKITDYKTALINSTREFTKPTLLYLSGGIDSELVALAMLDAKTAFTPVIFHWTDNSGKIQNDEDTKFANAFCEKHNLTPINKTVNIEHLWGTAEFKQLVRDLELTSPQISTHAYIVKLMNEELPNHTHLLGGEVRYKSDYEEQDGTIANVVYANKIIPTQFNFHGLAISQTSLGGDTSSTVGCRFSIFASSSYTWNFAETLTSSGTRVPTQTGSASGLMAQVPYWGSNYEVSATLTSANVLTGLGNGILSVSPSAGYAGNQIVSANIFSLNGGGGGSPWNNAFAGANYTIVYRPVGLAGETVQGFISLGPLSATFT